MNMHVCMYNIIRPRRLHGVLGMNMYVCMYVCIISFGGACPVLPRRLHGDPKPELLLRIYREYVNTLRKYSMSVCDILCKYVNNLLRMLSAVSPGRD